MADDSVPDGALGETTRETGKRKGKHRSKGKAAATERAHLRSRADARSERRYEPVRSLGVLMSTAGMALGALLAGAGTYARWFRGETLGPHDFSPYILGAGAAGWTGATGAFAALPGFSSLTGFAGGLVTVRRAAGLAAGRPFTLVAGPRADRGAAPFRAVAFFFTERGGAPRCCFAKPVCLLPKSVLRRAKVTNWP